MQVQLRICLLDRTLPVVNMDIENEHQHMAPGVPFALGSFLLLLILDKFPSYCARLLLSSTLFCLLCVNVCALYANENHACVHISALAIIPTFFSHGNISVPICQWFACIRIPYMSLKTRILLFASYCHPALGLVPSGNIFLRWFASMPNKR